MSLNSIFLLGAKRDRERIALRLLALLLEVNLPVRFLDGFPQLGLGHDLSHEVLDGGLGVQVDQVCERVLVRVEALGHLGPVLFRGERVPVHHGHRRDRHRRSLLATSGECVTERSLDRNFSATTAGRVAVGVVLLVGSRFLEDRQLHNNQLKANPVRFRGSSYPVHDSAIYHMDEERHGHREREQARDSRGTHPGESWRCVSEGG